MTIQELINNKILNEIYSAYQKEKDKEINELFLDIKIYGKDLEYNDIGPNIYIGTNTNQKLEDKNKYHTTKYNIDIKDLNKTIEEDNELLFFITKNSINLNIIFLDIKEDDINFYMNSIGEKQRFDIITKTESRYTENIKFYLEFNNINISNFYIESKHIVLNNLKIVNSNMSYFHINNSTLRGNNMSILFQKNTIDTLKIANGSIINDITFLGNNINRFSIFGTEIYRLHLVEEKIKSLHIESNGDFNKIGDILVNDSEIEEFKLANIKKINSEIKSNIIINKTNITNLFQVKNCKYIDTLNIILDKNNSNYGIVELNQFDTNKDGEYLFYNIKSKEYRIKNSTNFSSKFIIGNLETNKLSLDSVNIGDMTLNTVEIKEKMFFKSIVLNNGVFNNISFPRGYKIEDLNNIKETRDIYRQLKYVMDKNLNFIERNKFYEKELGAQKDYYLENGKCFNWFILWIQKLVGDYGNNWGKILFTIIIFSLLSDIVYSSFWDKYSDFLLNLINLLSPFFGLSKEYYDILKDDIWLYLGFVLYKIIYGILLYLFIIALKRETKR